MNRQDPGVVGARRIVTTAPLADAPAPASAQGVSPKALLDADDPRMIGSILGTMGGRADPAWRVALDRATDVLLQRVGDDGLWRSRGDADAFSTTAVVVQGLMTWLPCMPATRSHYVMHVLEQTRATIRCLGADVDQSIRVGCPAGVADILGALERLEGPQGARAVRR